MLRYAGVFLRVKTQNRVNPEEKVTQADYCLGAKYRKLKLDLHSTIPTGTQ